MHLKNFITPKRGLKKVTCRLELSESRTMYHSVVPTYQLTDGDFQQPPKEAPMVQDKMSELQGKNEHGQ